MVAGVGFPQLILALLQPCYETVKAWLQENLLAVGIFGLCTALVQILGLTFAMTMYCQVVKADTYCA